MWIWAQEVEAIIGYRRANGKWITQPNCHGCRAAISANPKRWTGPNRNKTGRVSGIVFGSQKKVTDYAPD